MKQWWYSQDEERWNGPCDSREAAIADGRSDYDDESFMVVDAEQGHYDLSLSAVKVLEMIEEDNEENSDPDGNNTFTSKLTPKQIDVLFTMLNDAIAEWVLRESIDTRAWAFKNMGNPETIGETDAKEKHST